MRHHTYRRVTQRRGEPMELLQLDPPEYGVHTTGIYIIDDEGIRVCAGPFATEAAAIASIEACQETFHRGRLAWRKRRHDQPPALIHHSTHGE